MPRLAEILLRRLVFPKIERGERRVAAKEAKPTVQAVFLAFNDAPAKNGKSFANAFGTIAYLSEVAVSCKHLERVRRVEILHPPELSDGLLQCTLRFFELSQKEQRHPGKPARHGAKRRIAAAFRCFAQPGSCGAQQLAVLSLNSVVAKMLKAVGLQGDVTRFCSAGKPLLDERLSLIVIAPPEVVPASKREVRPFESGKARRGALLFLPERAEQLPCGFQIIRRARAIVQRGRTGFQNMVVEKGKEFVVQLDMILEPPDHIFEFLQAQPSSFAVMDDP